MLLRNWFTWDCSAVFGGLLVFESGADVYVMLSPVKSKHVIKILLLLNVLEILHALFECVNHIAYNIYLVLCL